MRFLLDTNLISEATRPRPDPKVVRWLRENGPTSSVSVLTLGEVWKGIQSLPPSQRRRGYENWFESQIESFRGRILPLDLEVMKTWGSYCAEQRAKGVSVGALDSLIGATARHHKLKVATRNVDDFPGLSVVNPWR